MEFSPDQESGKNRVIINSKEYIILDVINNGEFATLYLVQNAQNEKLVLKRRRLRYPEYFNNGVNEIKALKKVQHKNVIRLIDDEIIGTPDLEEDDSSRISILLQYYKRGSLDKELIKRSKANKPYTPKQVLEIFLKICEGVKAFHGLEEPLAHKDLRTANILLDDDDTPIIIDLEAAAPARFKIITQEDYCEALDSAEKTCLTCRAPELFFMKMDTMLDERTDIWSLGCILYALCFYESPFETLHKKGKKVIEAISNGDYTIPQQHIYGKDIEELIIMLLKVKPVDRPHIDKVLNDVQQVLKKYV